MENFFCMMDMALSGGLSCTWTGLSVDELLIYLPLKKEKTSLPSYVIFGNTGGSCKICI